MTASTTLACPCGRFHLEVIGEPLIAAECHCRSCRTAAVQMNTVPEMANAQGGTPYVLYRKDRVRFPDGTGLLLGHRLLPDAPTRRVVTTCCNAPIFVEFNGGHWLSLYASLWPAGERPPMEIRTQTANVPQGTELDDSLPSGKWTTAGFYARLLAAWMAMGFRSPKVEVAEAA
jgi:hypothetical protein